MKTQHKPPPGNVRRVASTGQNIRGIIVNKAGRLVQFESWAERSLLLRLDRDPTVKDYGSQPVEFEFKDDRGKEHRYTPDFIAWRENGEVEIHEVTMVYRTQQKGIQQRQQAAQEICLTRQWRYVIHTEKTLPQGCELANLLALFHYRPLAYLHSSGAEMIFSLMGDKRMGIVETVRSVSQKAQLAEPVVVATLGHLIWHGRIQADLHQPLFSSIPVGFAKDAIIWRSGCA